MPMILIAHTLVYTPYHHCIYRVAPYTPVQQRCNNDRLSEPHIIFLTTCISTRCISTRCMVFAICKNHTSCWYCTHNLYINYTLQHTLQHLLTYLWYTYQQVYHRYINRQCIAMYILWMSHVLQCIYCEWVMSPVDISTGHMTHSQPVYQHTYIATPQETL